MISEIYYHNIREFLLFLKKNNINFFPIAGTLLGAYREGAIIGHDADTDFAVDVSEYEKIKELILNSDVYKFHMTWRRELCIIKRGYSRNDSQFDIFFMEKQGEDYCLFTYEPNEFTKQWDIEKVLKFKYEWFKEFKDIKFLDMTIKIPKGTEDILTAHYGDWKIPNKNWKTTDSINFDKDYKEVAIIIPTFLRNNCLKLLVESIKKTLPSDWYRLYIGDQGYSDLDTSKYYETLKKEGHFVTYLPFNSGLSFTRNYLVEQTKEPFILLIDDDFEFYNETKIQNFIQILNDNPNMGVVGGILKDYPPYNFYIFRQDDNLYYVRPNIKNRFTTSSYCQSSIGYQFCDIVLNFSMFKRELFKDIKWNPELKMCEHSDFYIRLKNLKKWEVGFTDTVKAIHQKKDNPPDYEQFRSKVNNKPFLAKFLKEMNLNSENNCIYLREK